MRTTRFALVLEGAQLEAVTPAGWPDLPDDAGEVIDEEGLVDDVV
jgi:hypothetical protein